MGSRRSPHPPGPSDPPALTAPPVRIEELWTERLHLRRWRVTDLAPFARLNADPRVARYLPSTLTRPESDAMVARMERHHERHGFGRWAVELREAPGCIGFVGLQVVEDQLPFAPCVEIGWRLASDAWGAGYATEAATLVLQSALGALGLDEVVSFTTVENLPSRAVMERIGMRRDRAGDFDHPWLAVDDPLAPHVLYRTRRLPASAAG